MSWNVRKLITPRVQCISITNRVFSLFDRFTAYYNCIIWNVSKVITPRVQCTSITSRVPSFFDRFTVYYNFMSCKFRKLVFLRVQCTKIINRVLSIFDRFSYYYNCMGWNIRNFITPRVQCTSITDRTSRLIWPFWCLLQLFELKYQKTHNSACSVHKHRKNVFVTYLTVLRLVTTVWAEMLESL